MMKMLVILLTAACLHVSAKGFTQTVTLSLKAVSMETAFREIEKQTGFSFIYGKEQVSVSKPVNLNVKNEKLETVLDLLFKEQPLTYSISGKYIAIRKKDEVARTNIDQPSPPIDVKGRIIDEEGRPVVAASVQVKGATKGTTTDDNGVFTLKGIDPNTILIISGANIQSFEWNVSGKTDLGDISSKIKIIEGQEVKVEVSTGYQKVSKERFTGSYEQMDSAAFHRRAGMGILERLDGTVTGLFIDKKTSSQARYNIQVRGISTLNGSAPLVIVDNFEYPLDLSNLNPNDIENITVLKDAAAASIWGARAGNGVIVITTKKGRFNQPLQIAIRSNVTITNKPDQYYYPQMSVGEYIDLEESLFKKGYYDQFIFNTISNPAISPVVDMLAQRRSGKISAADSALQMDAFKQLDLRRDLDKYAYRNEVKQQHYISVSAGSGIIAYNFSAGYNHSLNNTKHSKPDDQITLNSTVRLRPTKNLDISTDIRFSQSKQQSSLFLLQSSPYPYMQLADAEGRYLAVPYNFRMSYIDTVGRGQLLDWRYRPLEEPGLTDRSDITRAVQLGLNLGYRFTSWLNATVNYQYTIQTNDYWDFAGVQTYDTRSRINRFTNLSQTNPALRNPIPIGGILSTRSNRTTGQNLRGALNGEKTIGRQHRVSGMIAADISNVVTGPGLGNTFYNYNKDNGTYAQNIDYTNYYPQFPGGSVMRIPPSSNYISESYTRFVSFSGNILYSYKGRYSLYASARKDGSNIFGVNTNNKWKPLWSVGSSWDISKEKFYHIAWMSSLRMRATYGFAGNPGPNDISGSPVIQYSPTPAPNTNLPLANIRNAPNPDLRWEKVRTVNAGVDFVALNNRISGSIDVWQKVSTDVIWNMIYPPASGVFFYTTNSANLKGNGFEIKLSTLNLKGPVEWQSNFGFSHAKTIVTKLHFLPRIKAQDFIFFGMNPVEGRMLYGLSSYKWAGLDPNTGDPRGYLNKQVSTDYNSITGDSIQNQVFHGSSIPLYSGFVGNTFRFKNFSLSANITYKLKYFFRKPALRYIQLVQYSELHPDYSKRWQKPGDEQFTNVPSFIYPLNNSRDVFYEFAEINVLPGDHIKLQDVRLQYDWVNKKKTKAMIKGFQLYLYANDLNLLLWTKSKEKLDPEIIGVTRYQVPPTPRSYTMGVSLNF